MSESIIEHMRAISNKYDTPEMDDPQAGGLLVNQLEQMVGKILYQNELLPLSVRDIEIMLSTISMMCVIEIRPIDMLFVNTLVAYLINYYDVLKEADDLRDGFPV